jgi:hypothetical protein
MRLTDQVRRGIFLGASLALGSCNHVVGPALSARIESVDLRPTATVDTIANPSSICCCRVHGTVRNTSEIVVDVSLRFHVATLDGKCATPPSPWPGVGPTPEPVSDQNGCTAQDFQASVPPGASREFSAPGIFAACSNVSVPSILPDVRVIGHFEPR